MTDNITFRLACPSRAGEVSRHWRGMLAISSECGECLSEPRIRLLEAIEAHGSLSAAARALPMSYKAAWDSVQRMQRMVRQPLVRCATGGNHGGGTTLTEFGRHIIVLYRQAESVCQSAIDELLSQMAASEACADEAGAARPHQGSVPSRQHML